MASGNKEGGVMLARAYHGRKAYGHGPTHVAPELIGGVVIRSGPAGAM